jgi:large subunit ribosomal protein L4
MAATTTAPAFTKTGTKAAAEAKLDKSIFTVMPENHELLKLAYTAYLSNGRDNLAQTKTRGLVSGGGKKPWKQKGTGRARFGSSRNPIWRGGGIAFGPTGEENYTVKVNVAAKRQALRQALSLTASEGRLKVIESFDNKDAKVSVTVKLFKKIEATGSVLLVLDHKDDKIARAVGNLQTVKAVNATYLNVYDLMNADTVVVTEPALVMINTWLAKAAKPAVKAEAPAVAKAVKEGTK